MIENRTVKTLSRRSAHPAYPRRLGFTLVELLVVLLIILLVSAVTLPAVVSAISHRQVSEAARILQAALVGARDSAIHNNAISGIRLLPDPTINGIDPTTGLLSSAQPLAMSRIVPLEAAPDYDEGKISIIQDLAAYSPFPAATTPTAPWGFPYPYPASTTTGVLMVEECPVDTTTFLPNEPTSWFWNIRIGDKIRIGNSGQYYTVVGPMANPNPELFVNDNPPGTPSLLQRIYSNATTTPPTPLGTFNVEYLFLVNGQDDDNDGFVDDGWDGVDNDTQNGVDDPAEWTEQEKWMGALAGSLGAVESTVTSLPAFGSGTPPAGNTPGLLNQSYTITRRPAPSSGSREVALPSNVVIDLTTWAYPLQERSRFPVPPSLTPAAPSQVVNPNSGSVDIVVNPDGSIVPSTVYSSPSSFGLNGAFLHFWLAERSDVTAPDTTGKYSLLPLPTGLAPRNFTSGAELKGEYSLVTVYSRTGQIIVNSPPRFDNPAHPANGTSYNLNIPFVEAQQGVRGGSQ